jgi:transcription elongation GreA/GreB family factor
MGSLAGTVGALAATPAGAPSPAAEAAKSTKAADSTHATTGTVKSLSDKALVLTKSGKKHHEMTFQLGSSVHKDGPVAVGSHVSIRYRDEGSKHVATAITVQPAA